MSETAHATEATDNAKVSVDEVRQSQILLKLTYGLVPIVAGLDKFANILTNWPEYLGPTLTSILPVEPTVFMWIVGIIEMGAGIAVLSRWTREAAYVVAIWLLLIALNLFLAGQYDIAVRDAVMAIGAIVLAQLTNATA